ncbi:PDZ domain-containing protein [Clostridium fermenticellae]|uniref:PDZ domain-containing protein n=1 Tax=Clostridium fermenticellae TaxID=2068654 RepID=A0A386H1E3_9CLOT|nr:PDZ domain-containing protein [Clostridium fermenticellae]AYD39385.1 PDZ domain-containing protein [Clostridium fermenticellae]
MTILLYTLKAIAFALTNPYYIIILTILGILLYRKNKRTTVMQKMIIGSPINSSLELTISQIVMGIFAGALASIIMSYCGIVFDENSPIDLIFLLSIVLMFFNPKFICFSYSASLLGAISLILTYASYLTQNQDLNFINLDIVSVMSMVAVLHFVEGILVFIDGNTGYIPVFTNKDGRIIGGFALQRYWIIPIAILFMLHNVDPNTLNSASHTPMPNWWPILKGSISTDVLKNAIISLIPFYGVLGYNSVTFTRNKKQKAHMSGGITLLYSLILFGLARLAAFNIFFKILVIVFAPAAHEAMIILQRYLEVKGKPKYISSEDGIMVLEVAPNSPANEMGIKTGDLLIEVNNMKIEDENKVFEAIRETSSFVWFKVKRVTGKIEDLTYNKMNPQKRLGIVFVPRSIPRDSTVIKVGESKFDTILEKIKNKKDGDDDR